MTGAAPRPADVFRLPGYLAFWTAGTVSGLGSAVTTLALQVLVVVTLKGTATDVGLVSAARWLPYLLFGLVLGALVDRRRRKPLLVTTDLARAVLLAAIPGLWFAGWLSLPVLMAFVAGFGVLTLVNDAASQSILPRLVPAPRLLAANARIDQGSSVGQSAGPLIAGVLITGLGAPLAVLADAASYLFSAVAIAGLKIAEPAPTAPAARPRLGREIGEGLRFVYGHRTLAPLALGTHVWFAFNAVLNTVFAPFVLTGLRLSPFDLGVIMAAAGAAALGGAALATRIGLRWGAGPAVIACHAASPLACAIIALAPAGHGEWPSVAVLALGQGLYGFSLGAENANSLGYRQAVTPDALQSRMNTTIRSFNRAIVVFGAPLGGLLADRIGYRATLWIAAAGFVLVTLLLAASPFRHARHGEAPVGAGASDG